VGAPVVISNELRVLVEAEVEQALKNMKAFDSALGDSEKKTGTFGEAMTKMEKKALILSGVITAAAGAAVKFAGENEKLKASLEVMLGSADKASAIFEEWKQFGASTPLSVEEIAVAGKALLAFGVGSEEITDTLRRLGDVAQGVGSRLADVADIYGKARVQGRLFTNDINQFQGRGIPIVAALAKELGTTEAAIKDMVSEGKIGFPELEKAFVSMTSNGGKFEGMMEKISTTTLGKFSTASDNAQQALASFGELLLPMTNEILDFASGAFEALINMDDGTKRFILGMGGIVAAAGPTIMAIKGISAAFTALSANPWILGISGIILGIGAIAGIINKQVHAYEDLSKKVRQTKTEVDSLLSAFADGNTAKTLDVDTTRKLIELYPELSGKIQAYRDTVADAASAVEGLNRTKVLEAAAIGIERLKGTQDMLRDTIESLADFREKVQGAQRAGMDNTSEVVRDWQRQADDQVIGVRQLQESIRNQRGELNALLATIGKGLDYNSLIIDLPPVEINPEVKIPAETIAAAKKSWMTWWEEITKVPQEAFAASKDAGSAAGTLFVEGLEASLRTKMNVAAALSNTFDFAGALKSEQEEIQKILTELFSIDPQNIDETFTSADESVKKLIERFRSNDRALVQMGIEIPADQIADEEKKAEEVFLSFDEFFADWVSRGIQDFFPELSKEGAGAFAHIAASMASVSFDGMLQGLEEVGRAFAENSNAADAFRGAMVGMLQQMLDMLPAMFLQAGLQLIIGGQWALGLGFIAAAGSSALIGGYVKGVIAKEEEEAAEAAALNAHGAAYDETFVVPYGKGGEFTNRLINAPTYFRHGGGLGLMGEAGPEAVIPLRRMANGDLGVESSGGGSRVVVNIINNTGEPVTREESETGDGGRQLDIIIGEVVGAQIAQGRHDGAFEARFEGLRKRGR
jgi:tape measure domain-containing protein